MSNTLSRALKSRRRWGLWIGAVMSLSLALAAATVVFAIVDSVLLHPLPYPKQDDIVRILREQGPDGVGPPVSGPAFVDLVRDQDVFEAFAATTTEGVVFTGKGMAERWNAARVSADYFRVIGLDAQLGRVLGASDLERNAAPVAVLSYATWVKSFASDPAVLGTTLKLNDQSVTVVGVAPPGLLLPARAALATPLILPEGNGNRGKNYLNLSARLKPGVALETAQARMTVLAQALAATFPDNHADLRFRVQRLSDLATAGARAVTTLLASAIGLLILVGAASLINLVLADTYARRREYATRHALGASSRSLLLQLGAEIGLLLAATCTIGLLLGAVALRWLAASSPDWLPRPETVSLSVVSILATVAVATLVGAIATLIAATQVRNDRPAEALRGGSRGGALDPVRNRIRRGLVIAQIALSLVLLIGAGLLTASLRKVLSEDPGFDPQRLLTLHLSLPPELVRTGDGSTEDTARQARIGALLASMERAVRAVSGVREVGFVACAPVVDGTGFSGDFSIAGDPPPAAGQSPLADFQISTPGYFRAMGLQLEQGQMLAEVGSANARRVLINDAMARQYFGERNPLGMKLNAFGPEPLDIVGVVHGVRQNGLDDRVRPEIYFGWETLSAISEYTLLMRTEGDPASLLDPVRRALAQVDASMPVFETQTMDAAIAGATAQRRFLMQVMQFFALSALIIAVVGLYAVLSHAVAQRTSEFGVRLALGASARSVLGTVAAEGWRTLAAGVVIGLTGAYAAGSLLASRLYGVGAADVTVFALLTLTLVIAAQFSLLLPAWRASRVSPMQALREE